MIRHALLRKRVAATICGLAVTEWLLFELMRAPYRPPQDMTTFLGTEKYAVMAVMLGLAVGGLGLIAWWAARSTWTKRDVTVIALLVAVLMGAGTYVVINPSWPVTPLRWVPR
jgi:Na+/melibiose symporter-like transporter